MLTLRIIPPRIVAAGFAAETEPRDLAALYFGALWRRWRAADRAAALALAGAGALVNLFAARGDRVAALNGWDAGEQALLRDAGDGIAHLSMAARKGVHRLINPGAYPLAANPLKNKRLFDERCRAAGLPVPDGYAGPPEGLPGWIAGREAVIAKPNYASKGVGVAGFRRTAGGGWLADGAAVVEAEVRRRLAATLAAGGVVQRICPTHPGLSDISPGALPTLRVMTAVNEAGAVEPCDRVLRFSAGGPRAVDNFNACNFVAGIDEAGRVGRAYRRAGKAIEAAERHPATGAAIVGHAVPQLEEATALALRAHALFRDGFAVIGWDVGLAADGPVLIEGNWNPGADILQLVSGRGLGDGRLGALYRHHLESLPPAAWRAARPVQTEPRRG